MIHYTCDRCKNEIELEDEVRYEIQIDIRPVIETQMSNITCDDDTDHLLELHELLERLEDDEACELSEDDLQQRFDLCPRCFEQFRKNPLGRDALVLSFSDN